MKYIKVFEAYKPFEKISQDEYNDYIWPYPRRYPPNVRQDILTLNYREQEDIINFFKSKYIVTESLDRKEFIDNEVVIGFNRATDESSCWVNFLSIKTYPKTKKWMHGRREVVDMVEVTITKVDDEWFYIRAIGHKYNDCVKCDQLYGIIEYLKTRF